MKNKKLKILVTGSNGMLGNEVVRLLKKNNKYNIFYPLRNDLDLLDSKKVKSYLSKLKPDYVLMIAAKVGGINDNSKNQYEYIFQNTMITINMFNAFKHINLKKALYVGSSCIYPKGIERKIKEKDLLTGKLENTNEGYALAKILGLKISEYFSKKNNIPIICPMFTNIYGGKDNYNLETSHVFSALIKKFTQAKRNNQDSVIIWGSGRPKRQFIHVSDAARAIIFLIEKFNNHQVINVGSDEEVSIKKLANLIKKELNFKGKLIFDTSMPDGMLRKRLDYKKLNDAGFKLKVNLSEGIKKTIKEYYKKLD